MGRRSAKQAGQRKPHVGPKEPQRARVGRSIAQALQQAVDGALTAHVALFGVPPSLPAEGFDFALKRDWDFRAAKTEYQAALAALLAACHVPANHREALAVEACLHDLIVASAGVGWRMGVLASRPRKRRVLIDRVED